MKVCKFGGSSVASADQIRKVLAIIKADPARRIIVVSAPGKRDSNDTKVTDHLIYAAENHSGKRQHHVQAILQRFEDIVTAFAADTAVIAKLTEKLNTNLIHYDQGTISIDAIKALGEDFNAQVIGAVCAQELGAARYVHPQEAGLILSDEPGQARILPNSYSKLAHLRDIAENEIVVFPGFFGVTENNEVVTFSRGGSDITGSILAAAIRADVYENFTDVSHVFAADPRAVPNAQPVSALTFREMRELAYAGFGVFHDEALVPVVEANIPVRIANTNAPDDPGTWLQPNRELDGRQPVAGIASAGHFLSLDIAKVFMNREIGFGKDLLTILADENVSFEHMPSGIDNMSIIIKQSNLDAEHLQRVTDRIRTELRVDELSVRSDLALVMVVGEGMHESVGVASRATSALAQSGVNIEMINQGASEISLMFAVASEDRNRAVHALHDAFFLTTE